MYSCIQRTAPGAASATSSMVEVAHELSIIPVSQDRQAVDGKRPEETSEQQGDCHKGAVGYKALSGLGFESSNSADLLSVM